MTTTYQTTQALEKLNKNSLLPNGIDLNTRLTLVGFNAKNYQYWGHKYSESNESHSNSVVALKFKHVMVEKEFWVVLYSGAQQKKREITFAAAYWTLPQVDEAMYLEHGIKSTDNEDGIETILNIVEKFDYLYFTEDEASEHEPLLNSDSALLEWVVEELETITHISLDVSVDINQITSSDVKRMKVLLEQAEDALLRKTASRNIQTLLASPLVPLSTKAFFENNNIKYLKYKKVVMSSDYMPTKGYVVELLNEDDSINDSIVFEIDDGFYNLYGEGTLTPEFFTEFHEVEHDVSLDIFKLLRGNFTDEGELVIKLITVKDLQEDENLLKKTYLYCSEVCEGEFADYMSDNHLEVFSASVDEIQKHIQDFRKWGEVEA